MLHCFKIESEEHKHQFTLSVRDQSEKLSIEMLLHTSTHNQFHDDPEDGPILASALESYEPPSPSVNRELPENKKEAFKVVVKRVIGLIQKYKKAKEKDRENHINEYLTAVTNEKKLREEAASAPPSPNLHKHMSEQSGSPTNQFHDQFPRLNSPKAQISEYVNPNFKKEEGRLTLGCGRYNGEHEGWKARRALAQQDSLVSDLLDISRLQPSEYNPLRLQKGVFRKLAYLICFPINMFYFFLFPNVLDPPKKTSFWLTLLLYIGCCTLLTFLFSILEQSLINQMQFKPQLLGLINGIVFNLK